jgi:Tol biopolymer transport system component
MDRRNGKMKPTKLALLIGLLCAALSAGYLASQATYDKAEVVLQAAIKTETVDGDLRGAIEQYKKIAALPGAARATVATALLRMGQCHEKLGEADTREARKAYELVVREYADQAMVAAEARAKLAALGREAGSAAGVTVRQVWAGGSWYRSYGVPFHDSNYLSFRTESEDLAIRDLATGEIRQLTKHESVQESVYTSIPSPDGKLVAYTWDRDGGYEVRVVGVDGAEPRVLVSDPEVEWLELTDWSPDGQGILTVLHRGDRTSLLALVSVHDASLRILKDFHERVPMRPRYSPDGRYIAYALQQGPQPGEGDIFVLDLDGGREIPLVQHPANDVYPDWTPDGRRILFLSNRTGVTGAWWIPVAEGHPQGTPELVKPDLGEDLGPIGFTRNGSYYYGVHTEMSDVYIAELDLATGKLISAPSAATQRFVGSNSKPDWSPDGRRLLFFSKRGPGAWGARAFCVRTTESGDVRELPSKLDRMWGRWSLDGRSVLGMAMHPTEGIGLYRIDVQTGDFVAVPRPPGHYGYLPVPSRGGKAIIYQGSVKEPKKYCVLLRDLETGQNEELYCFTDPAHFVSRLTLSPDGGQLAFVMAEDTEHRSFVLKVISVEGGEARDVLRGVEIPFCEAPIAWTPDGSSLLFLRQARLPGRKTELWLVSIRDGEIRPLELASEGMRDICLHPDGRHIAFTEEKNKDEVWVLENILPAPRAAKK